VSRGAVCLTLLVVALIGSAVTGQEQKRTVWDGVYTAAQAERGRGAYAQACASCHADDLRGKGTAPSLVEESFAFLWADMSVGDLFERTRTRMPSDRPNSLPSATYADVIAFIAQKNGYPAGSADLDTDVEILKLILITPKPLANR
jgi:mono/diheme cytochrome c family protein